MVIEDFVHDLMGNPALFYPLLSKPFFSGTGFASELINLDLLSPYGDLFSKSAPHRLVY